MHIPQHGAVSLGYEDGFSAQPITHCVKGATRTDDQAWLTDA